MEANPSQGWFGKYHCEGRQHVHVLVTFEVFHPETGFAGAYVTDDIGDTDGYYVSGYVKGSRLCLDPLIEGSGESFDGGITVMQDGTIILAGPVTNQNCSGFVLKGAGFFSFLSLSLPLSLKLHVIIVDTAKLDSLAVDTHGELPSTGGSSTDDENENKLWMVYGILIAFGAIFIIEAFVLLCLRNKGYEFRKKDVQMESYSLMEDNKL